MNTNPVGGVECVAHEVQKIGGPHLGFHLAAGGGGDGCLRAKRHAAVWWVEKRHTSAAELTEQQATGACNSSCAVSVPWWAPVTFVLSIIVGEQFKIRTAPFGNASAAFWVAGYFRAARTSHFIWFT